MITKIFQWLGGGESNDAPSGERSSGGIGELESFVDYVVRNLVDTPDKVRVDSEEQEQGKAILIRCEKEDMGKVIGRNGQTISAIRNLVSNAARRLNQNVSVEVVD